MWHATQVDTQVDTTQVDTTTESPVDQTGKSNTREIMRLAPKIDTSKTGARIARTVGYRIDALVRARRHVTAFAP
jgi:hypothetical protein